MLKEKIPSDFNKERVNLNATTERGRSYERDNIIAKQYNTIKLTESLLIRDLNNIIKTYEEVI